MPQALNRYTAVAAGQPGVLQAADQSNMPPLLPVAAFNTLSAAGGVAVTNYANNLSGILFIQANNRLLARAGYTSSFQRLFPPGRGRSALYTSELVKSGGGRTYTAVNSGRIINLNQLEAQVGGNRWPVTYPHGQAYQVLNDNNLKQFLRSRGGQFTTGLAINVALSFPDLAAPWQDPYLNKQQRWVQNAVTVGGAGASAAAAIGVSKVAAAAGLGGPVTFALVTSTGIAVWVVWEYAAKPTVSWIATSLGRPDPYQGHRNLQPIGGLP
jgi:hypothetical protein